jgi:hypothetical protein
MKLVLALIAGLSIPAQSHEGRGRVSLDQAAALQSTEAFERLYDGGRDYSAVAIGAQDQAARTSALTFARAAKPRAYSSVPPVRFRNTSEEKRGNIPLTGGLLLAVGWGGVMGTILYRARPIRKQR